MLKHVSKEISEGYVFTFHSRPGSITHVGKYVNYVDADYL